MQNAGTVNLSGTNQVRFMAQPAPTSEGKESSVKKYFTAPNVILGSLATVGVLGMADILICKGKHLNKITGKTKEYEEVLSRATAAETRATAAETRATTAETRVDTLETEASSLKERLKALIRALEDAAGEELEMGEMGDVLYRKGTTTKLINHKDQFVVPLHKSADGDGTLKKIQQLISDFSASEEVKELKIHLKRLGYEVKDDVAFAMKNIELFEQSEANIEKARVTVPVIMHVKSGKRVADLGVLLLPLKK